VPRLTSARATGARRARASRLQPSVRSDVSAGQASSTARRPEQPERERRERVGEERDSWDRPCSENKFERQGSVHKE
jgi:hypothetical protein